MNPSIDDPMVSEARLETMDALLNFFWKLPAAQQDEFFSRAHQVPPKERKPSPSHTLKKTQQVAAGIQPAKPHPTQKWLKENGEPFTDDELRKVSKTWKPKDWERYLASLETAHQREYHLTSQKVIDHLTTEDYTSAIVDLYSREQYPHLKDHVEKILKTLTHNQRRIVFLRYWENKSLREIAEKLGVRYQTIQRSLKYSHSKIERGLRQIAAAKNLSEEICPVAK